MLVDRGQRGSKPCVDRTDRLARSVRRAALATGLALAAAELLASPVRAEAAEPMAQEPASDPYAVFASRLGGWSPQFEFGFGVLTQSQDGETTVPTTDLDHFDNSPTVTNASQPIAYQCSANALRLLTLD